MKEFRFTLVVPVAHLDKVKLRVLIAAVQKAIRPFGRRLIWDHRDNYDPKHITLRVDWIE